MRLGCSDPVATAATAPLRTPRHCKPPTHPTTLQAPPPPPTHSTTQRLLCEAALRLLQGAPLYKRPAHPGTDLLRPLSTRFHFPVKTPAVFPAARGPPPSQLARVARRDAARRQRGEGRRRRRPTIVAGLTRGGGDVSGAPAPRASPAPGADRAAPRKMQRSAAAGARRVTVQADGGLRPAARAATQLPASSCGQARPTCWDLSAGTR